MIFRLNKYYIIIICFLLFILTSLPFFIKTSESTTNFKNNELFNDELSHINSLDKSICYVDSIYNTFGVKTFDTLKYIQITSEFTKERFFHGLSNYTFTDNWLIYLLGTYSWGHFLSKVESNSILKHQEALCSQQNIVFTEILQKKGITFRTVGLGTKEGPGHFLTEVWYQNDWHLYDVDLEPNWDVTNGIHFSLNKLLLTNNLIYEIYDGKIELTRLNKILEHITYGKPNEFPAKRMLFFHKITFVIIYILPFLFLFFGIKFLFKKEI